MNTEDIITQIAHDKSWQTNLEQDEVLFLMRWVRRQLTQALDARRADVKGKLRTVNQMLGRAALERPDLVRMMTDGNDEA